MTDTQVHPGDAMTTRAKMNKAQANESDVLCERISPLLAGHAPEVQGAVLAELLALFLAGHQGPAELREEILRMHLDCVRALIPVFDQMLRERMTKQ
jgi:hypothetical protein